MKLRTQRTTKRTTKPRTLETLGVATALAGAGLVAVGALRRRHEEPLDGKTVLLVGGTRGLGLALAHAFATEGARVAIAGRDLITLRSAVAELERAGATVFGRTVEARDPDEIDQLVRATRERFGRIDVLVHVAAAMRVGPAATTTEATLDEAMETNFRAAVHGARAVLPEMLERRQGRIVFITSVGGKVSVPHLLPYGCSKFALVGFSEGLRAELAGTGVQVTTVVPGLMRTGSQVNARYAGNQQAENRWFSLSAATPLTSMNAERAARRIVRATRRGEAEVVLTWQAKLLILAHAVAPGLVQDTLGWAGRTVLPDAPAEAVALSGGRAPFSRPAEGRGPEEVRGAEMVGSLVPSPATTLVQRSARRLLQYAVTAPVDAEHARKAGLAGDGLD